jgi:hypothetical protein
MRPQRPLPTVPFAKSRYAAARTCAAAILAAICPGGTMPISTARWPHRRCGRRTASAWSSMHSVSGDATTVKHPRPSRPAKYFHVPNAAPGTISAEADMRRAGRKYLAGSYGFPCFSVRGRDGRQTVAAGRAACAGSHGRRGHSCPSRQTLQARRPRRPKIDLNPRAESARRNCRPAMPT